ncbi:YifB family Mg chelatase-like AAA ATPase [Candidatus Kaiserbacteria bacterium]|nr:YifB family Mg chelatase-like AAA ATPase [Candidatus Kaiserbacteria bacterium]
MGEKQKIASGFARVYGAQPMLPKAAIVAVECDIVKGLHAFTIVGLPDKSVEEAKDRIAAAIKNTEPPVPTDREDGKFESPKRSNKKIVLSLAPAALKKEGAVFDIPLALVFLLASKQAEFDPKGKLFAGELALDGTIRPILGALSIASAAKEAGFTDLYIPEENFEEVSLISGLRIHAMTSLEHGLAMLQDPEHKETPRPKRKRPAYHEDVALDEIRGQEGAKRGLIIAAAGGHNIALYGPPGTGKTLLARAASAILPDLSEDEMIEVTTIHSLAGTLTSAPIERPPFRSPHHTSSYASLIGGGSASIRPGEVTLAHRGVLFADEFPEFHRDVVNALREPLEDRLVSIARAKGSAIFPANFMLIAALNPCPCGFWGSARCKCMPHAIEKYRRKISGPVADRFDMWVHVGEMPPEQLTVNRQQRTVKETQTREAREVIAAARGRQRARFKGTGIFANADMKPKHIEELVGLSDKAESALQAAARQMKLSPRGYHRTIKLARTIADLAGSDSIVLDHMMEALQYRQRDL